MINHETDRVVTAGTYGDPVDPNVRGWYQDELTVGIERLITPTLTVGFKGKYRTLRNVIEDRCDLDYTVPETNYSACGLVNLGTDEPISSGHLPTCLGCDDFRVPMWHQSRARVALRQPDLSRHRALHPPVGGRQSLAPGELHLLVAARQLRRRRQPGSVWADVARDRRRLRLSPDVAQRRRQSRARSAQSFPFRRLLEHPVAIFRSACRPSPSPARRSIGRGSSMSGTARRSFSIRGGRSFGCRHTGARTCPSRIRSSSDRRS